MKKIQCVAIDDEPLALDVIENFCARIPELELRSFNSPVLALEYIKSHEVEILFLDIKMPEMMGIEIAAQIGQLPYIIFSTAFPEYAIESYEYNSVGYLLKPYNFARFEKAVQKAMQLLKEVKMESSIAVKIDYRRVLIPCSSILYVEAMGNYVKIYTNNQCYLPQMTMKEAEDILDKEQFMRVHRSYIVNTTAIESNSSSEIIIANTEIPIGKSYRQIFKQSYKN